MSTAPTLEDKLRSHYRSMADELHLRPIEFENLLDVTRPVTRFDSTPSRRPGMFAAAAIALVAVVAGVILLRSRVPQPSDDTATTLGTIAPTTLPALSTTQPLALSSPPAGLQLVGQGIRPVGGQDIRAAVFIKRDEQDNISERVIARVGELSLYANGYKQLVLPPNLVTATSGSIVIDQQGRTVRVEYGLGTLGNLALEAYHFDELTNGALSDEMQQIASVLNVEAGHDISVIAPLPNGWTLATVGSEPENSVPSFFQAFEVDSPEGGPRIIIDNRMLENPEYPYWAMSQTLQPVVIRGHSGFVTTHDYFASTAPNAPAPASNISWTILIWEEAPGHWVTMWVANTTTDEAVALAQNLVAVEQIDWPAV